MKKQDRQRLIRQLLSSQDIERQEDFVRLLEEQNIHVTQATISRDIKEMQLVKVPAASGGYRYNMPIQKTLDTKKKLTRTLQDAYVSMGVQDKDVVIKVLPGNGHALASMIEEMDYEFVFGVIGDDSTVLAICKNSEGALQLESNINDLLE
ncbi:ArgR family transcriptional regulator [Lactobacillus sp. LC28-10]|uniref:Arginine repressor n=1 Tax=Secundilactobacillus angelensis TaxID=2722706 RepID=A0ABX1KZ61_9LACO|nr:ArgR family transcriptional regulator [Secundilactobacillus angelensis]NLR19217.1 ArgR family transcriptional regulator [Secundilactobacillus angelensis]